MRERDPRTGKQLPSSPYAFFRDLRKKPRGVRAARAPFPWGTEAGEGAVTAQGPGRNPGAPPTLSREPSEAPGPRPALCQGLHGSAGVLEKSVCVPASRPAQAGGTLSAGPAQPLNRFRRARKVRFGGTAAPGPRRIHWAPSARPACHRPHHPTPGLPDSGVTRGRPGLRWNQTSSAFIREHSREEACPPLDLAREFRAGAAAGVGGCQRTCVCKELGCASWWRPVEPSALSSDPGTARALEPGHIARVASSVPSLVLPAAPADPPSSTGRRGAHHPSPQFREVPHGTGAHAVR